MSISGLQALEQSFQELNSNSPVIIGLLANIIVGCYAQGNV
jgi:hypothetical protein